ncbi:MAG: UDP-glucose 4-epimerase GalE [Candidatus Acidiferrales bacterium]
MGMRILVTGGAGYIGSTVAAQLVESGHTVVVIDDLRRGHRGAAARGAELIVGNVGDAAVLERAFSGAGIDAVMHFAALAEVGESMLNPGAYFSNNTSNTLRLIEAMVARGVRKIVFSSTAAVFGSPERTPIEETAPKKPTNPYGESKLQVEQMLAWFYQIHGLRYATLRYFNVAGGNPNCGEDHVPESHLVPRILQVALGQYKSIKIFGDDYPTPDGTCVRDYVHVSDLAQAHVLALGALESRAPLIYNLGNGKGFSVREVVEAARRVTGHEIPAEIEARRPGDPPVLVASSEKIIRELGWAPKYAALETIISSAWEWHRTHPKGYDDKKA